MSKRAIYYDTETTGISSTKDRIIELAAYDPVRGTTFEKLINPGIPIPAEATAIHKITNEMVSQAQPFSVIAEEFIQFCEGDVVLIAHNNDAFDKLFLDNEFQRHGLQMPSWRFLDSLKWARKYRRDLPRHSLQFLREVYNIPANNAHRALDDVVVLHQVFSYLLDDISIEKAIELLEVQAAIQQEIQHMPFGKHQGTPLSQIPKSYVRWMADNGVFEKPENSPLKASFEKLGLLKSA